MSTPNAPISVFDTILSKLAEIDTYESAYFEQSFSDYGDFEIKINWNTVDGAGFRWASYLVKGNFILFGKDTKKVGIILETEKLVDKDGKGGQFVTAKGKQAKVIFNRRLVEPPTGYANYSAAGAAETVMRDLVKSQMGSTATASRQVALLNVAATGGLGSSVQITSRYKNMAEDIKALSTQSNLGFNLDLNLSNKKLDFVVIPGVDRRASQSTNSRMIISTDYDTLQRGSLKNSDVIYKNVVYAAGQGVGESRNIRKVYSGTEPTGLDRREIFTDMRDLSSNTDIDARGGQVLTENGETVFVDASALSYSQFVLGTDYNLGDLITLKVYDESTDVRITKIKESWSAGKYEIGMDFNRQYPELPKQIAGVNNAVAMALNNSEPVEYKTTASGDYIRFDNGVMMAWGSTASFASSTSASTLFYGFTTVTFPVAFVAAPIMHATAGQNSAGIIWSGFASNVSTSSAEVYKIAIVNGDTGPVYWLAIGRWK